MGKLLIALLTLLSGFQALIGASAAQTKDLIVIAAPSVTDTYDDAYEAELFEGIIEFDVAYANAVYGRDNILILVDAETRPYLEGRVPSEILVDAIPQHIWMRDFTTVNPHKPVQFRYTAVTLDNNQREADGIQADFNHVLNRAGASFSRAKYNGRWLLLDGGNVVDNYAGRVIVTERFLEDNDLSMEEGKTALRELLDAEEVAIIPSDEPIMAHSDGMVMFSDENTLFVNRYEGRFRRAVLAELKAAFPGIRLVEIDPVWDKESEFSACGINLNATVTSNFIYMPHFGDVASDEAMELISKHTAKTVVPVPANGVCKLGGSVRCLSWQQSGRQGEQIFTRLKP